MGDNIPVADPIFVVGAPRSGTTWLAKIFDSHPDVLYRHEPDIAIPPSPDLSEDGVRGTLANWATGHSLRCTTKRPFFAKSWRSPNAELARTAAAYAMLGAARLSFLRDRLHQMPLPDMGDVARARLVIKTVAWCEGLGPVARALPASRTILVLRSPFGQVFSVMRGAREGRFELRYGGKIPLDKVKAKACARSYGVDDAAFDALPPAAQYAWGWMAFNEAAARAAVGLPNVRTVYYSELCENPEHVARDLFSFAGLHWHPQTAHFVRRSAQYHGNSGYYDVFQDAAAVPDRWRRHMSSGDQDAVRRVVRRSPIARHWPELADVGEAEESEPESFGRHRLASHG